MKSILLTLLTFCFITALAQQNRTELYALTEKPADFPAGNGVLNVTKYFAAKGVSFPPGTVASYQPGLNKIIVVNSDEGHKKMKSLLATWSEQKASPAPTQNPTTTKAQSPTPQIKKPIAPPAIAAPASKPPTILPPAKPTPTKPPVAVKPPATRSPAPPAKPAEPAIDPEMGDLDAAIAQAKAEDKKLFIKFGWSRCGNCRNLDNMMKSGQVKVPEDEFVIVNVHPIKGPGRTLFSKYYGIKSGVYPRVLICDSDNKVLAKRFGYGRAADYNNLLTSARKAPAGATASTSSTPSAPTAKPVIKPATPKPQTAPTTPKIAAPTFLPPKILPPAPKTKATPAKATAPTVDPEIGDLDAAIAQAKAENKKLFVKYGWSRCGNCRNLDGMIKSGKVNIPEDEFVTVNIHPVSGEGRKKFTEYYGIKSGIYPRVVICDSDNNVLAKRFGYGRAADYNNLLQTARGSKLAAIETTPQTTPNVGKAGNAGSVAKAGSVANAGSIAKAPAILAPKILPPVAPPSLSSTTSKLPPATTPPPQPEKPAEPKYDPAEIGDLKAAVAQAKAEGKYVFVKYGWAKCGACKHLDGLIARKELDLPEDEFVIVNVHPVTGEARKDFTKMYDIQQGIFPRVVIADSENRLLAKAFGFKTAAQYVDLLQSAYEAEKNLGTGIPEPAAEAAEAEAPPAEPK